MKSDDTHIGDTVRVLRPPPKVYTDRLGRSFWMPEVDETADELDIEADGASFGHLLGAGMILGMANAGLL